MLTKFAGGNDDVGMKGYRDVRIGGRRYLHLEYSCILSAFHPYILTSVHSY